MIKAAPADLRYENALIVADGDYVVAHGRFSDSGLTANSIAVDIVRIEDGRHLEEKSWWSSLMSGSASTEM